MHRILLLACSLLALSCPAYSGQWISEKEGKLTRYIKTIDELKIGQCLDTGVMWVGTRLQGDGTSLPGIKIDLGSKITYSNGDEQASFETIPNMMRSKIGDDVRLCLIEANKCEKGYIHNIGSYNLRTKEKWEAYDRLRC
jgi:hypothetical protein